jgi:hypothetical protein
MLVDYKFELAGNLQKGEQVIRVETPGPAMHEADIFRLHEGKTVDDLRRWRKEDHPGPAPADALGWRPGQSRYQESCLVTKKLQPRALRVSLRDAPHDRCFGDKREYYTR